MHNILELVISISPVRGSVTVKILLFFLYAMKKGKENAAVSAVSENEAI